jgi:3-hydroxyisobutyrate dehydrogenase-like beta-hydroxyacid dehydrogenase
MRVGLMKVGFIGLGRMGRGMALRILDGKHDLAVYDVLKAQTEALAAGGARVAASVADVCAGRQVVVTMLVEDAAVLEIALSPGGLCDSLPAGAIHLAMGTYGVAAIRTLAEAHGKANQVLVAAPVLGRPDLAAAGQLGIVVAGPEGAVATCNVLLEIMGRRTFVAGTLPEAATAIKLANNMLLGCAMVAMAEGFSLVRKYDVAPAAFYDVITQGLFAAPAYKGYGQTMVDESYDRVGSPVTVGLKDANLILAAADIARVPMPSLNVYRDRLLGAVAHGDGDRDQAVLAREQARASGIVSDGGDR